MRLALFAAASLSAMCWAQIAAAQADAPPPQDSSVDPDAVIIVTGEKAQRSLQDTVTSVAVTTGRRIETENLVSLQDVLQRTANVTDTYGVSGFTIRGIANRGISGGGDAALATVYVDGAALPSSVLQAAPTDMWDVAQVEILRGPQSTLQGLNALAGAIIVQTAEPGDDWELRAKSSFTDAGETRIAVAAGGPLIPGELALRVSADKRDADGFTWNPTRGTDENPLDSLNLRAKLRWTPAALAGFEARLAYNHYERYGGYAFSYTDVDRQDFHENRTNTSNDPNDSDATTDIATLDLRQDLGGDLALTSVSSYNDVCEFNRFDNDGTAADDGAYDQRNRFRTFSQEVRLNYANDWLSGLLGVFYYNRDQQIASNSRVGVPTPVSTISGLLQSNGLDQGTADFLAGMYAAALPEILVDYASDSEGAVETIAVFGDARIELTDRLALLGGFRYDRETNRIANDQVTTFAGTYPDPAAFGPAGSDIYYAIAGINAGVAAIVAEASGSALAIDRTFEAFLPKGGVEMAWTDDITLAFTVQRGYRSGGSSSNVARSQTFPYDPEYTWNYELSLRSVWLDGALTLNANAFHVDWTSQQTSVNFGLNVYDTHTVNAGKSHLYGFELEAAHRVNANFDWYASLGHTRTRFDEFTVDSGSFTDLSGLEFPYAPHWTLSGGMNLRSGRLTANLNASHRSAVFSEASKPQADVVLPPRTLVNARVSYEMDHWTLSAFASNIFDEKYVQYGTSDYFQAVLGDPRVLGISFDTRW
jgi:iron complex outermembrane recepter protein